MSNEGGRLPVSGDSTLNSYGTQVPASPLTGSTTTGTVSVIDRADTTAAVSTINVGLHPTAMYAKGSTLFVANTNGNTVPVVDTATNKVVQTTATQPWPEATVGYEPDGITMTADGPLLVILGRANAVAVYHFTSAQQPIPPSGFRTAGSIPMGLQRGLTCLAPDITRMREPQYGGPDGTYASADVGVFPGAGASPMEPVVPATGRRRLAAGGRADRTGRDAGPERRAPHRSAAVATAVILYGHLWWRSWYRVDGVQPYRVLFNVSTVILSCQVAALVAHVAPGELLPPARTHDLVVVVLVVAAYSAVNSTLAAGALAALRDQRTLFGMLGTWQENSIEYATLCMGVVAAAMPAPATAPAGRPGRRAGRGCRAAAG